MFLIKHYFDYLFFKIYNFVKKKISRNRIIICSIQVVDFYKYPIYTASILKIIVQRIILHVEM